jgi:hypothetical protein
MADIIPDLVWRDAVIVERFRGRSSVGAVYDLPIVERCVVSHDTKLVRATDGREVTSAASIIFPPQVADVPVESRVTMPDGQRHTVLMFRDMRKPALPTPDHTQIRVE